MGLPNTTEPTRIDRANGATRGEAAHNATLAAVADALSRLRYGAVHLTVHDGKVVQLDVTERQRFT
ncbi:hypothetical protein HNO88_002307 [Novosphingobium chloroacetimidivorans]|uniref:DUF2292 domain-containing protein n=1 Tax=Novosphingobium chloroacetimidivorans TaxID=1428314 RepID=A0A7W7NW49_9SPHN|nr:YezD family protein [Novosphingobium chloroacetimidivorans]MBB4858981.1 hypothetical protein [Novosphingobium chloroacetimidivorans]